MKAPLCCALSLKEVLKPSVGWALPWILLWTLIIKFLREELDHWKRIKMASLKQSMFSSVPKKNCLGSPHHSYSLSLKRAIDMSNSNK